MLGMMMVKMTMQMATTSPYACDGEDGSSDDGNDDEDYGDDDDGNDDGYTMCAYVASDKCMWHSPFNKGEHRGECKPQALKRK
jgi:hypothetical protein